VTEEKSTETLIFNLGEVQKHELIPLKDPEKKDSRDMSFKSDNVFNPIDAKITEANSHIFGPTKTAELTDEDKLKAKTTLKFLKSELEEFEATQEELAIVLKEFSEWEAGNNPETFLPIYKTKMVLKNIIEIFNRKILWPAINKLQRNLTPHHINGALKKALGVSRPDASLIQLYQFLSIEKKWYNDQASLKKAVEDYIQDSDSTIS
jgi:hypothetical protein